MTLAIKIHRQSIDDKLAILRFDAETARIVAARERNYRNSGECQVVASWLPFSEIPTAEVRVYRGAAFRIYHVKKRSPSAFRLAFLVGENGRPLFGEGVTIHKGRRTN